MTGVILFVKIIPCFFFFYFHFQHISKELLTSNIRAFLIKYGIMKIKDQTIQTSIFVATEKKLIRTCSI